MCQNLWIGRHQDEQSLATASPEGFVHGAMIFTPYSRRVVQIVEGSLKDAGYNSFDCVVGEVASGGVRINMRVTNAREILKIVESALLKDGMNSMEYSISMHDDYCSEDRIVFA